MKEEEAYLPRKRDIVVVVSKFGYSIIRFCGSDLMETLARISPHPPFPSPILLFPPPPFPSSSSTDIDPVETENKKSHGNSYRVCINEEKIKERKKRKKGKGVRIEERTLEWNLIELVDRLRSILTRIKHDVSSIKQSKPCAEYHQNWLIDYFGSSWCFTWPLWWAVMIRSEMYCVCPVFFGAWTITETK